MTTGLPRMGECRECHDPIRFVNLPSGKALPVDPMPSTTGTGNVAAHLAGGRLVGFVISKDHRPGPLDPYRFTAHHATCEAIDRTRKRPAPEPHPSLF